MSYQNLRVGIQDRVAWLEYQHPPVNAFDWGMLRETGQALDELLNDGDARVVVFASALDRFFSVGADIRLMQEMGQEGMRDWVQTCHTLVRQMRQARKPLLAAIHGTAVGAGLEVVLHTDVRFAAADARLGQPEINIAIIPGVGTTQSLARLLGRPRALRFLYEGALVSAKEALTMGLVDIVAPPEQLRDEVRSYAAALAGKPAETLAAIRRCITEGVEVPFDAGLDIELAEAVRLAGTPDFAEGLRAFLEKRSAKWAQRAPEPNAPLGLVVEERGGRERSATLEAHEGGKEGDVMRWEYMTVIAVLQLAAAGEADLWKARYIDGQEVADWKTGPSVSKLMNQWGADGWELVNTTPVPSGNLFRLVFKRPSS